VDVPAGGGVGGLEDCDPLFHLHLDYLTFSLAYSNHCDRTFSALNVEHRVKRTCRGGMIASANFQFLGVHDPSLATLGGLAERYFRDDPPTALIKLRQLAEALAKLVAAHHALYLGERETFEQTLRRLSYDRILPRPIIEVFHRVRTLGNIAAHEGKGTHGDAAPAVLHDVTFGSPGTHGAVQ